MRAVTTTVQCSSARAILALPVNRSNARKMNEEDYFVNLHKEELESDLAVPRTPKSETKLPWEKFYMAIAYLASQRSEDPNTTVSHFDISVLKIIWIV